ncbi:hypothetical protein ACLOJK_028691 [Asimina triloba]
MLVYKELGSPWNPFGNQSFKLEVPKEGLTQSTYSTNPTSSKGTDVDILLKEILMLIEIFGQWALLTKKAVQRWQISGRQTTGKLISLSNIGPQRRSFFASVYPGTLGCNSG